MLSKAFVLDRAVVNCAGFLLAFYAALLSPVRADPRYPDWPCMQPKVRGYLGAVRWSGPRMADFGISWKDDSKVRDIVKIFAPRRTPLDSAQKAIADFMTGSPAEKERKAKLVFAGVFDTLGDQRRE